MDNHLKEITQSMKYLSEYDKEVWSGIFDNLYKQQKEMFEAIRQRNEEQLNQRKDTDDWKIVTALIEKNMLEEAKRNGLYEMLKIRNFRFKQTYDDLIKIDTEDDNNYMYSAGIAFLKCKYSELHSYLQNKYRAVIIGKNGSYETVYFFQKYDEYKKIEEIVEKTANQYEMEIPVLLSPMSRRAVHVIIDLGGQTIHESDILTIDFKVKENGLDKIIDDNLTMVWNVEFFEEQKKPKPRENTDKNVIKKLLPLFDEIYMLYEFSVLENEYIFVDSKICDIKRYRNSIYINMNETEKIEDLRYSKIKFHYVPESYMTKAHNYFTVFFDMSKIQKVRVRTEGDIDYIMGSLKNDIAVYSGLCRKGSGEEPVHVYESEDSYHYPKNKALRSSSVCYLKFVKSENIFFEDYVSYIMSYLNYYYPEFYWVGVV